MREKIITKDLFLQKLPLPSDNSRQSHLRKICFLSHNLCCNCAEILRVFPVAISFRHSHLNQQKTQREIFRTAHALTREISVFFRFYFVATEIFLRLCEFFVLARLGIVFFERQLFWRIHRIFLGVIDTSFAVGANEPDQFALTFA